MNKILITLLIYMSVILGNKPIAVFDITLKADAIIAPEFSPDNQYVIVTGTTDQRAFLIKCNIETGQYSPIFKEKAKKKKTHKKKKKNNSEEKVGGWDEIDGKYDLYISVDIMSQDRSGAGNMSEFYFEDKEGFHFESAYPNKLQAIYINPTDNSALVSFLNSPYGIYKIDLANYTLPLSKILYKTDRLIQGISGWKNSQLILAGMENIYHFYELTIEGGMNEISIDIGDYTIMRDSECHTEKEGVFSFIGSNNTLQEEEKKGYLCIYDLNQKKYIKKLSVYFNSETDSGNRFSQWASKDNKLFFLRKDQFENVQLFYYDLQRDIVERLPINEKRIKSFAISKDGKYCAILRTSNNDQLAIYKLK